MKLLKARIEIDDRKRCWILCDYSAGCELGAKRELINARLPATEELVAIRHPSQLIQWNRAARLPDPRTLASRRTQGDELARGIQEDSSYLSPESVAPGSPRGSRRGRGLDAPLGTLPRRVYKAAHRTALLVKRAVVSGVSLLETVAWRGVACERRWMGRRGGTRRVDDPRGLRLVRKSLDEERGFVCCRFALPRSYYWHSCCCGGN
jgi:hypothetical protein